MSFKDCLELGVDFMEIGTGYIFKIAEHERAVKFGLPVNGIRVIDSLGNEIGIVEESEVEKYRGGEI